MNAKVSHLLARLRSDQRGLTTVEYAIVLCLVAAVVVGTWQEFGTNMKERLSESSDKLNDKMSEGNATD